MFCVRVDAFHILRASVVCVCVKECPFVCVYVRPRFCFHSNSLREREKNETKQRKKRRGNDIHKHTDRRTCHDQRLTHTHTLSHLDFSLTFFSPLSCSPRVEGDALGRDDVEAVAPALPQHRPQRAVVLDGYHTSRVSDVAKEAGVAYGLVYHYFGSKEDLLETIFRRTWTRMLEAVEELERSDAPAREQLAGVARIVLGSWELDPDLVRVLVREVARSPQLGREVDEIAHAFAALERIVVPGPGARRAPHRSRSALRCLDPLRRARGDPDRLGLRAAAGGRRRRRSGRADGRRAPDRRPCGGLIRQSIPIDPSVNCKEY